MANVKITDLTAYTDAASTDVLPVVDVTNDVTKKISIANLLKAAPLGSAAAPGIAIDGDPDTGLFSAGANQIGLATNGAGRLFVGSAGDVGIGGAPSGSYKLEVKAGAIDSAAIFDSTNVVGPHVRFSTSGTDRHYLGSAPGFTAGGTSSDFAIRTAGYLALLTGGNNERLRITSAGLVGIGASSPGSLLQIGQGTASTYTDFAIIGATTANYGPKISLQHGGSEIFEIANYGRVQGGTSSDVLVETVGSNKLQLGTNRTVALTIDTSQRVGIGNNAPGNFNSVANQVVVGSGSGDAGITLSTGTSSSGYLAFCDTGNTVNQGWYGYSHTDNALLLGANGSERARIDSSGRLLVGTSSYSGGSWLRVQGSGGTPGGEIDLSRGEATPADGGLLGVINFTDNTTNKGAWIFAARDGGSWSASSKPSRLVFSTTADSASSPTERMRIRSSGEVLVNSTALLDLTGQSFQVNGWSMFYQATSGTTASAFTHTQSGTQTVCLFRQGNPAATVGSITVSGGTTTTYNTSSDYRLKENIVNISDGIDRLLQLKPSRFNFISNPGKTVDGFVAHEVQDIVPEAITGDKDAVDDEGNPIYQGIDQSKLVPLLTAALQEAVTRIKTLEAKVAALEAA